MTIIDGVTCVEVRKASFLRRPRQGLGYDRMSPHHAFGNTSSKASAMSVIYEVNLAVDREIAVEYRSWLVKHVQEMLALPGFTGARIMEAVQDQADAAETAAETVF